MPQKLVVNEWLLHDLRGENGKGPQKLAVKFLDAVAAKSDLLIVVRGGAWMAKAYQLARESDPHVRIISKYLHLGFIQNEDRCRLYDQHELIALPDDVNVIVPRDDVYLVRLYLTSNADSIITTDTRLNLALSIRPEIRVELTDRFFATYFA